MARTQRPPCRDDEPLDGDALAPWVWAFLGEFPAAGIALGPTLAAWQRSRDAAADTDTAVTES